MSEAVAVAIVAYNAAGDLPDCLAAIARQTYRPLELVLIDNASLDDSLEVAARSAPPGLPRQLFRLSRNLGYAAGMNAALALTGAPLVLALNADARPAPDFIARLVDRLGAHPDLRIGAVTGRLRRFAPPAVLDACGMRLTLAWRHLDRGSGEADVGQYSRPERVFGCTGAASLFVRAALDDAAAEGEVFDSRFHSFREDAELCFRLRERGWEVLYEPRAVAEHRRANLPERRRAMPPAVNLHSLKNRYLLRAYHQGGINLALTLLPSTGRDLLALGYALLVEHASLPAYAWLLRHAGEVRRRRHAIRRRRLASIDGWFLRAGAPL